MVNFGRWLTVKDQLNRFSILNTFCQFVTILLGFKWKCSKDFKKGDEVLIQAPWLDEIPTEEEMMSGALKRKIAVDPHAGTHKNSFLIPKK